MSAGNKKQYRYPFYRVLVRILCLFIVFLTGCFFAAHADERRVVFYGDDGQKTCSFSVTVAITDKEQSRGLMFREKLSKNSGMLFMYTDNEVRYFWMKNTLIPLDLIFLGPDRKVVSIFLSARPMDETTISSVYPARYVLEVNAGRANQCGMKTGTPARFFNIPNQ